MPSLVPRDNMGYAIHPVGIVILCMLGAGLLICCLYGMFRYYNQQNPNEGFRAMSDEQMSYIKDVRNRNLEGIAIEGQKAMYGGKTRVCTDYS